ncbi:hypothetical protein ACFPRL_09555 [Pseudoclavibacter helvolus]
MIPSLMSTSRASSVSEVPSNTSPFRMRSDPPRVANRVTGSPRGTPLRGPSRRPRSPAP